MTLMLGKSEQTQVSLEKLAHGDVGPMTVLAIAKFVTATKFTPLREPMRHTLIVGRGTNA
jgi:hypothetical protein